MPELIPNSVRGRYPFICLPTLPHVSVFGAPDVQYVRNGHFVRCDVGGQVIWDRGFGARAVAEVQDLVKEVWRGW